MVVSYKLVNKETNGNVFFLKGKFTWFIVMIYSHIFSMIYTHILLCYLFHTCPIHCRVVQHCKVESEIVKVGLQGIVQRRMPFYEGLSADK